jgi:hypothetical protein
MDETKFTEQFMAQQRELEQSAKGLSWVIEGAGTDYIVAAANHYAALDEIERLQVGIKRLEQIISEQRETIIGFEQTCKKARARVAALEASEARLEKGNAAYEELTRRLVERFSDQIAWSDIIEMQVEISRERK